MLKNEILLLGFFWNLPAIFLCPLPGGGNTVNGNCGDGDGAGIQ